MPATVFIVYCVGSNWLNSGCGPANFMKSQLAMVGTLSEFCYNALMFFVALKLHSRSPVGIDVAETTFVIDFKS
jgi:hypothetical protein